LFINLKTGNTLGVTAPQSVQSLADEMRTMSAIGP
jgi:hypothetical protein